MDEAFDPGDYVRATAAVQGLDLDEAEIQRAIAAFALVARFARPALDWPAGPEIEPAPVFKP